MYISSIHRSLDPLVGPGASKLVQGDSKENYTKKIEPGTLQGGSLDLTFYDLQSEENIDEAIAVLGALRERFSQRQITLYVDGDKPLDLIKTTSQRLRFHTLDENLDIAIYDLDCADIASSDVAGSETILNIELSERYYYVFLQMLETRTEIMRLFMESADKGYELGLMGVNVYNIEHPHNVNAMSFWVELQVDKIIILSKNNKNESY